MATQKPPKTYLVYKRTAPDGRIYIGCTCQTLTSRAGKGGKAYKRNPRMWEAICKYGWESFTSEVLLVTQDQQAAEEAEQGYIEKFDTTNPEKGFNYRIIRYTDSVAYCNTAPEPPTIQQHMTIHNLSYNSAITVLGIDLDTFTAKLNHQIEFTAKEIALLKSHWELSDKKTIELFIDYYL